MKSILYRRGYKYQLAETYTDVLEVHPDAHIDTQFLALSPEGLLTIRSGYAWDGASGPAVDTPAFMRGSLVHDALYQMMRLGLLDREKWKNEADQTLRRICRQDGMSAIRAAWVYAAVVTFGKDGTLPEPENGVIRAPSGDA